MHAFPLETRRDTYEGTLMFYCERSVKGNFKLFGMSLGHFLSLQAKIQDLHQQKGQGGRERAQRADLEARDGYGCRRPSGLRQPLPQLGFNTLVMFNPHDVFDLGICERSDEVNAIQKEEKEEQERAKRRKQCGLPEWDPEALPSTQCQKHMTLHRNNTETLFPSSVLTRVRTCLAKSITKMDNLHAKFDHKTLSDVQKEHFVCIDLLLC